MRKGTRIGLVKRGVAGVAREILIDVLPTDPRSWTGTLSQWYVEAPNQSPAWSEYYIGCVHLRPIEGGVEPVLSFPEATHEFVVAALDPSHKPKAFAPESWYFLTPINLVYQVKLPNDATAVRILSLAVGEVVNGRMWAEPPLSGQEEPWRSFLTYMAEKQCALSLS
ncbi:MAG: hypothetical protein ACRD34_00195 [Bryobacteraceae bacterium]